MQISWKAENMARLQIIKKHSYVSDDLLSCYQDYNKSCNEADMLNVTYQYK